MYTISMSIIVALILLIITITIGNIVYNRTDYNEKVLIAIIIVCIFVFILAFCISSILISSSENINYIAELEEYNAKKQTIEQAIYNENLGGLERIELVNQASELNAWLAEQKVKINKWSKFDIKQDVKDLYNNAEYISLE